MEIFHTEDFYVLLCGESSIWINKKTGELDVKPAWELANGQDLECLGIFFGYIGRIKCSVIEDCILLVKDSCIVGELPSGHAVHKVKSIAMFNPTAEMIPDLGLKPCSKHHRSTYDACEQSLNNSAVSKTWSSLKIATTNIKSSPQSLTPHQNQTRKNAREREKYQRRIKEELHRIFTDTDSFYFCPAGGDITNTIYRQLVHSEQAKNKNQDRLDFVDDRFFWNKYMLQDVLNINSDLAKVWVMPVIQGYIEIKQCKMFFKENQKYEVFVISLISRRSRRRVGTRYKRRGLDEHGHCANYVETEQILQYKSHVVSFVQIRGSIPLFWSQQGYKYRPPPQLHKSYEENQIAFEKHLVEEIDRYGPVVIVNLVERTGKEAVVGNAYAEHICSLNSENITYVTFDLHQYCRGMKFENVSLLVDEIQDEISKMSYCWVDSQGLISCQSGVFRINCIDCLDRTNLVQTSIAREVMMSQLIKLGLSSSEMPNNLLMVTQQMWANNGDVISKQYAGTNALKGDITRTGNRKISGLMKDGMNSANRYYLSRFKDSTRQATLDIMLGNSLEENMIQQKDSSEDEDDGPMNEMENLVTLEHIKQIIDDVKKLLIEDPSSVIAAWALLNADDQDDASASITDMDTILVLTQSSCYIAEYDSELDNVTKFQEIQLKNLKCIEIIIYNDSNRFSSSSAPVHPQKSSCFNNMPILKLVYCPKIDDSDLVLHFAFKSTNLRFFNNIAVAITNDEEKIESLKAIAESIQIAYEINGFGELELNVKVVQCRGSLLIAENFKTADIQFSSLRNVGSKALSNVSQQFSKFNRLGQNFKLNRNQKMKNVTENEIELPENDSQEMFLSTTKKVRCNTNVESTLSEDNLIQDDDSEYSMAEAPQIVVNETSNISFNLVEGVNRIEKCHSSDHLNNLVASQQITRSTSEKDLSLNLVPTMQEDNAFQCLKSGFASATNALVSPSSPLSRLAKGVQNLSTNFGPRRLRHNNERTGQESFQITDNVKLKELWLSNGCRSKLIAL